jgi:hypothetical protein
MKTTLMTAALALLMTSGAAQVVWPSSQSMVTSLQDVPVTVPRSVVVAPQQRGRRP